MRDLVLSGALLAVGFAGGWLARSLDLSRPKPVSRIPRPDSFELIGSYDCDAPSRDCILVVQDEAGRQYEFRGSTTVWHHHPTGERAGALWGLPAASVEHRLYDIWKLKVARQELKPGLILDAEPYEGVRHAIEK